MTMLYWKYLVFIFCSVNNVLNLCIVLHIHKRIFKETLERVTLTVNNNVLFYRIQGIERNL